MIGPRLISNSARIVLFTWMLVCVADVPRSPADDSQNRKRSADSGLFSKVPEQARLRHNPLAGDRDAVGAGKKLFAQHCAQCHGLNAEGGKKAPSLRIQLVQSASPGAIFWVITNGVVLHGMPVWSKLPEPERWQITSYVKSLSRSAAASHPRESSQ